MLNKSNFDLDDDDEDDVHMCVCVCMYACSCVRLCVSRYASSTVCPDLNPKGPKVKYQSLFIY